MKNEHQYLRIEVVTWKHDSVDSQEPEVSEPSISPYGLDDPALTNPEISWLPGFLHVWPIDKKYLEKLKIWVGLLEHNQAFQTDVLRYRNEMNIKILNLSQEIKADKKNILDRISYLSPSFHIFEVSKKLSTKYLRGLLHLNLAVYLIFDYFPIEEELLGLSCLVHRNQEQEPLLIEVHKSLSKREFKRQGDILYDAIKPYFERLPILKYPRYRKEVFQKDQQLAASKFSDSKQTYKTVSETFSVINTDTNSDIDQEQVRRRIRIHRQRANK